MRLSYFLVRGAWVLLSIAALDACLRDAVHETSYLQSPGDWPVYGGNSEAQRYSALTQINRRNVAQLKFAWRFDSAERGDPETNPLIADGVLYAYSPTLKVIALDAAGGKQLWQFDPGIQTGQPSRGLTMWSDAITRRLFAGVMNYLD